MQRRRRCQEQEHANPPHSVMFCPVLSKGKVKSEKRRRRRANELFWTFHRRAGPCPARQMNGDWPAPAKPRPQQFQGEQDMLAPRPRHPKPKNGLLLTE
eukprot:gene7380-biopygen16548